MIITIDGPSGTGKSTVARKVADKLHFAYFDTGAMYRAFTWYVIENNIDIDDPAAVQESLAAFDFNIVEKNGEKNYFICGNDVTEVIRTRPVTARVSAVSALKEVRDVLLKSQRQFAEKRDAVFEGRDLGTVVFPNADVKVYLTADPEVRAERRLNEILAKRPQEVRGMTHEQMLSDIIRRDEYDSTRQVAPLRCPPDAFQIDTTHLSVDQVVDRIVKYCVERYPQQIKL